jgi:hypothetical protein
VTQRRDYCDDYNLFIPVEDTEDFKPTYGRKMRRRRTDEVYDEPVSPRWL